MLLRLCLWISSKPILPLSSNKVDTEFDVYIDKYIIFIYILYIYSIPAQYDNIYS